MKKYTELEAEAIVVEFEKGMRERSDYRYGAFRELFKQMVYQHPGLFERIKIAAASAPVPSKDLAVDVEPG